MKREYRHFSACDFRFTTASNVDVWEIIGGILKFKFTIVFLDWYTELLLFVQSDSFLILLLC